MPANTTRGSSRREPETDAAKIKRLEAQLDKLYDQKEKLEDEIADVEGELEELTGGEAPFAADDIAMYTGKRVKVLDCKYSEDFEGWIAVVVEVDLKDKPKTGKKIRVDTDELKLVK